MAKPVVLLIGGWDPQGCAGLAADIKTVEHHDCHAVTLVTALTEQTRQGLTHTGAVTAEKIMADYACIKADFSIEAIKIGLIPNLEIAQCIKRILIDNPAIPVVLDPVLATSSGGQGIDTDVSQFIVKELLTLISLLTPNLNELELLTEPSQTVEQSVTVLKQKGLKACLSKGGHADSGYATDFFQSDDFHFYCYQPKWPQHNVRGTGCVLATSIVCHLAVGQDIRDAIILAKAYISRGIRLAEPVGPYYVIKHSSAAMTLQDVPKLCYQAELVGRQFDFPPCPQKLGIYPVVDTSDWIKKLVDEGIKTVQLRIKDLDGDAVATETQKAIDYVKDKAIAFFINDFWSLAIDQGAYGVHLGQEDLHDAQLEQIEKAGLRLGVSTHSYWELSRALAINPSYIALGPIYETSSKQMPFSPQGEERVKQWVSLLEGHYPLVAIGGINQQRAERLRETGVGSVAMISAITQAEDYQQATQSLIACWH